MEDRTYKITIAVVISAIVIGVSFYGTYLPLRKSQVFINTLESFSTTPVSSIKDLEDRVAVPFDYSAPIGQEELVRNFAGNVLQFAQQADPTSTAELISFLNIYFKPILDRGKGMSFGQDLYLAGAINDVAYSRTGNPVFLADAFKYYLEGKALGPNRPQILYGLFDVYRAAGDVTNTKAIAQTILQNWPNDPRVGGDLQSFLAASAAAGSGKKAGGKQ